MLGCTLRYAVVSDLSSSDGSFDGSNDGKPVGGLLCDSLGEDGGREMGSPYSAFDGMLVGSTLGV